MFGLPNICTVFQDIQLKVDTSFRRGCMLLNLRGTLMDNLCLEKHQRWLRAFYLLQVQVT